MNYSNSEWREREDWINSLDLELALRQLRARDLVEEWVPDLLRYEDQLSDAPGVIERARHRLRVGGYDAPRDVEVPKTAFSSRAGRIISLEERVAYHAVVASFAPLIDQSIGPEVHSARLTMRSRLAPNPKYLTKHGIGQWTHWVHGVRNRLRQGHHWLVCTDLTTYFDTIQFAALEATLADIGIRPMQRQVLLGMLEQWSPHQGVGLLQGPDVSRVLGNLYLQPVDRALDGGSFSYSRFMDDVRITAESKVDAIRGLHQFELACRARGLIVSVSKTAIHRVPEALEVDSDAQRRLVQYFWSTNRRRETGQLLREMVRQALSKPLAPDARSIRFGLGRLIRLRDDDTLGLLLENLDSLAPVAGVVGHYLSMHVHVPGVLEGIRNFISSDASVAHPYLVFHLLAAAAHAGTMPGAWRDTLESEIGQSRSSDVRAAAAMLLATCDPDGAQARLKDSLSYDDNVFSRGCLIGIRQGGRWTAAVEGLVAHDTELSRTAVHLRAAKSIPSLVDRRARFSLPR